MKKRYKHKTGIFGTDAERFASALYLLHQNPNGNRRPDLISNNGRYNPKLSLEIKSGGKQKGVMVDYQLHYGVTTEDDYKALFDTRMPARDGMLPYVDWDEGAPRLLTGNVAYYYCLVNRIDGLKSEDMDRPWSAIKINFGDQYILPHQYGFAAFAAARVMRTGETLDNIVDTLKRVMMRDLLNQGTHYEERKSEPNSWQNLHGRDFLAIFENDPSRATAQGMERIKLIQEAYDTTDLKRIEIPGPNNTKIYVLAEPAHNQLFDRQLRRVVVERTPAIEKIARARKRAESLLQGIVPRRVESLLPMSDGLECTEGFLSGLSRREIGGLNRLVRWLDNGEEMLLAPKVSCVDFPEEPEKEQVPY